MFFKLKMVNGILFLLIIISIVILSNIQIKLLENFNVKIYEEVKDLSNSNHDDEYPMPECRDKHFEYLNYGNIYKETERKIKIVREEMEKSEDESKKDNFNTLINAHNNSKDNLNKKMKRMIREDNKKSLENKCFNIYEYYK